MWLSETFLYGFVCIRHGGGLWPAAPLKSPLRLLQATERRNPEYILAEGRLSLLSHKLETTASCPTYFYKPLVVQASLQSDFEHLCICSIVTVL